MKFLSGKRPIDVLRDSAKSMQVGLLPWAWTGADGGGGLAA
jgi:hypothetical protein